MQRILGVFEHTQVLANAHFPFNVVVVLRLTGAPASDILQQAFRLLRNHHPLLGVRIQTINDLPCFDTNEVPPIPFQILPRNSENDWHTLVEKELSNPFNLSEGPLLRVSYLESASIQSNAKKNTELVLTFQHVIMDATSGSRLILELLSLCADLEADRCLPEIQMQAFPAAADYYFSAKMKRGKGAFIFRQLVDELSYQWHSRGKRQPAIHDRGKSCILPLQLSKQSTTNLIQCCRRNRVTLNSALTAAMLLVVQRRLYCNEERLLRNFVFANLRPYVIPPLAADNLCSCYAMLRFTARVPKDANFWDLVQTLNTLLYQSVKRGDKYHNFLMSKMIMKMMLGQNRFRMGHTAMSYTGEVNLPTDYDGIHLNGLHAFVSNFVLGPEYTAQVRLFDKRLWWDFVYLDCDMDASLAENLAREIFILLKEQVHAK